MRAFALVVLALTALSLLPTAAAEPVEVKAGVYVLSLGNYDVNRGTYTIDFYLFFRWDPAAAPEGFTPERFEFMNGRATVREKVYDSTVNATGERELWYRIQANLYSAPHFENFPFDTQEVEVLLEDSVLTEEHLVYVPMDPESGLDEGFTAAGWRVSDPVLETLTKDYRFGETYSRLSFSIELSRERFSTAMKSLLPPGAMVLVAGLAFVMHPSKWGNRVGLGTGMLISAVMFHISQTVALPPMPRLILFDKVMIAVYLFILSSLAVTALIAIDEDYWKDRDYTKQINTWGAIVAVSAPGIVLLALLLL